MLERGKEEINRPNIQEEGEWVESVVEMSGSPLSRKRNTLFSEKRRRKPIAAMCG